MMAKTIAEYCPHCGICLQGDPIPEEAQESFGATHFSRKIGRYDLNKDVVIEYSCPDCGGTWDRSDQIPYFLKARAGE